MKKFERLTDTRTLDTIQRVWNALAPDIEALAREVASLTIWRGEYSERLESYEKTVEDLAQGDIAELRSMVGEMGDEMATLRNRQLDDKRDVIKRIQALEAANSARGKPLARSKAREAGLLNEPSAGEISASESISRDTANMIEDVYYYGRANRRWALKERERAAEWEAVADKLAWDLSNASNYLHNEGQPELAEESAAALAEYEALKGKEGI